MTSEPHIGRAMSGAFAMARFDRRGLEFFDFSYDGFWRSFTAVLIALPVVVIAAALTPTVWGRFAEVDPQLAASAELPRNITLFAFFEALSFVAGWAFFPVAMIWVARRLNLGGRYVPLIVAYNWGRVITTYAWLVPPLLFGLGLVGAGFLVLVQLIAAVYLLAYRWFIIRSATEASATAAFGLMLFDILGTFLVETLVGQIYWLLDPGGGGAAGNS